MVESSVGKFETGKEENWTFRLYIAGPAPNSRSALNNLNAILEKYLKGQYRLEIIDILESPLEALKEDVFVAPTLVKVSPPPVARIIGNLNDRAKVLAELGIEEYRERGSI